jgi:lipopolysaccharide transport system permease protein
MFSGLIRHRDLVWQMTKRDIIGRYRGSMAGVLWSFFHPVLMLAVYTFVFSGVFKARWGAGTSDSHVDFAVVLFAGLLVHGLFAECVNRAPLLVVAQPSLVKKVVFPLEILPWVAVMSALFHTFTGLLVLLAMSALGSLTLSPTVLLFPVVLAPLVVITLGFVWFLSSTGVFLRDLSQGIGVVTTAMLFLSPVFYSSAALGEPYRTLLRMNPLSFIVEQAREVLIWGRSPNWTGLAVYLGVSLVVARAGFWWFQKTRRGFADVL